MGRPKQLLPVGGLSLLDRVLGETLKSDLHHIVLVLGHRAREIRENLTTDLHHEKLKIIENKNYRDGISSSILAGLSEVEDIYDQTMIILGDMPHVNSGLINLQIRQYLASRLLLGAIKLKDRRTHPVIIGRRFYQEIHQMGGDVGARTLFEKYPAQVCMVEPRGSYSDMDIDTMEDYRAITKSLEVKSKGLKQEKGP